MKAKGWMAMALALVVAGTGTCMLAGAIANKQGTELTTSSSVSEGGCNRRRGNTAMGGRFSEGAGQEI